MKVLHLCTNFIGNKLFQKKFSTIADHGRIHQEVYIPIRRADLKGRNSFQNENVELHYDLTLRKKDRLMYKSKIKKQVKRVEQTCSLNNKDLIHAHTLYSDGGTAYLLKKKYQINYIVSIRNTDINIFYKYFFHLRGFMYRVLIEADSIVFISESYKKNLSKILPKSILDRVSSKFVVIPNGIDNDWYKENKELNNSDLNDKRKLIFTGTLYPNKNLITVLKVLKTLNESGKDYVLDVAGDGPDRNKLQNYVKENKLSDKVFFHGHLSKRELQVILSNADIFILPSIHETFGISYIEAMSKGLPVLYTKNEGIDGFFEEGQVGYSIQPLDVEDIIEKIKLIESNYEEISAASIEQSKRFSWEKISKIYLDLYTKIGDKK